MPDTQSFVFETNLGDYVFEFTNPAQLNQLWGQIAGLIGQEGVMGQHSSSHGVFTPDPSEGGRQGVGNLSKDDARFQPPDFFVESESSLSGGTQGLHAVFQAARLGDPNLPQGAIEATFGPLFGETNGQITVTFFPDLVI